MVEINGCLDTMYEANFTTLMIPKDEKRADKMCSIFNTTQTGALGSAACFGTVTNEISCTKYVYDQSQFINTAVSEVITLL